MNIRTLLNRFYPLISIAFIPFILVFIWFREGYLMATAESGIPFYNPELQLRINDSAWSSFALGVSGNVSVALIPSYWVLTFLSRLGIPHLLLQAGFFWFVLFTAGLSIYLLMRELFPDKNNWIYLGGILFYWFNPFSLVNIWNRFLYNFQLSYVLLPLVLFFFIKGIKSKKYVFSFLIGLISFIFSYALTAITFDILLWAVLFYTAFFYFISLGKENRSFILKFTTLTFFYWSLVNFWWISQIFSYVWSGSFNAVSVKSFTLFANYQTFSQLSQVLGNISDLIRLRHSYFFDNPDLHWAQIFNFPILTILNFLIAGLVLVPIITIKKRLVFFLGGLFLIGLFLAKGNNPPFGELNDQIFLNFPLTQLFRNPFEKFGYLLLIASTLLFGLGLDFVGEKLSNKFRKFFYFSAILIISLTWGMPFWTGYVFVGPEIPLNDPKIGYQIKIPSYYKEASEWLESQKDDFRVIVLPLGGEGITYRWEKGYAGVELTNQLLPKSAISFNTNIPFYDDVSKSLQRLFLTTDALSYLANVLNVKYIMYRPDIDWEARKMKNPREILVTLEEKEKQGELKRVAEFGKLIFWEILPKDREKIYLSNSALLNYSKPDISDLQFADNFLVINLQDKIGEITQDQLDGEIVHPQAKFFLDHEVEPVFEIRQDIFPHVTTLPKERSYPFILIKDFFEEKTIRDQDVLLDYKLVILGKRLVEAKFSADVNDEKGVETAIRGYRNRLNDFFNLIDAFEKNGDISRQSALQAKLYLIFQRHIKVLNDLKKRFGTDSQVAAEINNTLKLLGSNLKDFYIYPAFDFFKNEQFPIKRRMLFNFAVKGPGSYELLWDEKILNGFYKFSAGDLIILQIDNRLFTRKIETDEKGHISLGEFFLGEGNHEIGLNLPEAINLLGSQPDISFKVDHGSKASVFPIKNYDPYSSYNINFDYWIKKGNGPEVLIYDKSLDEVTPQTKPAKQFILGPDLYDFTTKNFFAGFRLPEGNEQATVSLIAFPWKLGKPT